MTTRKKTTKKTSASAKPRRKTGRSREAKTSGLLTRALVDRVEELVVEKGFLAHVAAELGVHRQRFHEWVARGEREPRGLYREFADAVQRGRAKAEEAELHKMSAYAAHEADWKASAWKLEKMNPSTFGTRTTTVTIGPLERMMKLVEEEAKTSKQPGFVSLERLYELSIAALEEEA